MVYRVGGCFFILRFDLGASGVSILRTGGQAWEGRLDGLKKRLHFGTKLLCLLHLVMFGFIIGNRKCGGLGGKTFLTIKRRMRSPVFYCGKDVFLPAAAWFRGKKYSPDITAVN